MPSELVCDQRTIVTTTAEPEHFNNLQQISIKPKSDTVSYYSRQHQKSIHTSVRDDKQDDHIQHATHVDERLEHRIGRTAARLTAH